MLTGIRLGEDVTEPRNEVSSMPEEIKLDRDFIERTIENLSEIP